MNKCFIYFVFLLSSIAVALACLCARETRLQTYCRNGTNVVVVNVGNYTEKGYEYVYDVTVEKVIKSTEDVSGIKKLVSLKYQAMCGVDDLSNQKLLITAQVAKGSFSVIICDFVRRWNNLTDEQKAEYSSFKQQDCVV
ncbi:tissue inhibitor of metalloproteases-like protein [Leptotrombidium deliense]|uniref:Tissue inhibitor of metalloproteases-like protein n=1 Tax=Leptotrombidium deliense TaxID=299467 RepID=A0A443S7W7_9ACAR|nr:tissue inhibitor of metalloproteases-like protein [Leptotrombidium deliense]